MTAKKSHIALKYKEIDNGEKSIYLDYYKGGKRIREALHLYLLPETSKKNISANKRTMKEAEAIRIEKEKGLLAVRFGIETKESSPMRIGEAIDEYEKIIFDKGDISPLSKMIFSYSSMASPMRMGDDSLVSMPKRTASNPFSFSIRMASASFIVRLFALMFFLDVSGNK